MNAELHKQWLNLTLADNFLFQKYMQNVENCKKLISEICGREVERIEYKNTEQSIEEGIGSKGIRLDVYFIGDNKVYNFEMQNRDEDLPKRNRYYHSMIDLKTLEKGGDYEDLKDVYVIFICTFDPFGKDCYIYKIKNQCTNVEDLEYEDGNHTIFLNTKGQYGEISDYLKAFLKAVDGKFDSSEFSSQIRKDIDFLKTNENLEGKYMNYAEIIRDAKKEGIREGREYGTRMTKIKVIKMLLEKMDIEEIIELGFDEELVKKAAEKQND